MIHAKQILFFINILSLWLMIVLFPSCASSPRFSRHEQSKENAHPAARSGGARFSSAHIEEEKKTDDKKIPLEAVAERFGAKGPKSKSSKKNRAVPEASGGSLDRQRMMDVILGYLGTPYKYGGVTRSGIDCSAFSGQVYAQSANMVLPRTAVQQVTRGKPVGKSNLQFGDLIFFNTTGISPSHVGIYIGDNMFAHASEAFGVTISSLESSYYKKKYTEARRVMY